MSEKMAHEYMTKDVRALIDEREALRDRIEALESELKALRGQEPVCQVLQYGVREWLVDPILLPENTKLYAAPAPAPASVPEFEPQYWLNPANLLAISNWKKFNGASQECYQKFSVPCKSLEDMHYKKAALAAAQKEVWK